MHLSFIPIPRTSEEARAFAANPLCTDTLEMTLAFYERTGFMPPWICYYVQLGNELVGSAGFKGMPVNGTVEIAYGTFAPFRTRGIGTAICHRLVSLARAEDPRVNITARTLPEENYSTRILRKNDFRFTAVVNDMEDGDVWEWQYDVVV